MASMRELNKSLIGNKYGRLTITNVYYKIYNKKNRTFCECKCDCGNIVNYVLYSLYRKNKSCGCWIKDNPANYKHGMSIKGKWSKEYSTYRGMLQRCYDVNMKRYKDYGGRGINVCDRWLNSFNNFFEDMGKKPNMKCSLDRIDNNKGYSKENCRWVDTKTQCRNTRRNRYFEYNGVVKISTDWAIELSIPVSYINKHLNRGKSFEQVYLFFKNKKEQLCY